MIFTVSLSLAIYALGLIGLLLIQLSDGQFLVASSAWGLLSGVIAGLIRIHLDYP